MLSTGQSWQASASLAGLYAPVENDLAIATRLFDAELAGDHPFIDELCERVRSYRGKMLRPALLLLTAKAAGDVRSEHHTLAAVVEMVHMATLVHDDVLDEADERRKSATVNAVSGNVAAVLLGDYLISHSFHLCSSLDSQYASRLVGSTTNTVCTGELLQNFHRGNAELDEATYFEILRGKTGALTATACELGARFAGANDADVAAMRRYGMATGVAFQIIDDVLDIAGDQDAVGKSLGLDLTLGKLTLPTIHCVANAERAIAKKVLAALTNGDGCDRATLLECLSTTDSLAYARSVAEQYVADALRQLDCLPPCDARTSLTAMAEFIVRRGF